MNFEETPPESKTETSRFRKLTDAELAAYRRYKGVHIGIPSELQQNNHEQQKDSHDVDIAVRS
jgi:hypothetical protein